MILYDIPLCVGECGYLNPVQIDSYELNNTKEFNWQGPGDLVDNILFRDLNYSDMSSRLSFISINNIPFIILDTQ